MNYFQIKYIFLIFLTTLQAVFSIASASFKASHEYKRITWLGQPPLEKQWSNMYGHISLKNMNLKKMIKTAQYAKVINIFDYALEKSSIKYQKGMQINTINNGQKVIINKDITRKDEELIINALKDEHAHEILEFRILTNKDEYLVSSYNGHMTGVNFPIEKTYILLKESIKKIIKNGEKIKLIKIVHNHPIQAVEFFNIKKKSLGFYYSPFGPEDINIGNIFQKLLGKHKVELAILVGLKKNDIFKVSYYPKKA